MKRRSFVKTSLAGAAGTLISTSAMASSITDHPKNEGEFYELRVYSLKNDTQQKLVEDYLQDTAIPAFNRAGVKSVGVFTELKPDGQTKLYVLIPFNSMADFISLNGKLDKDAEYQKLGAAYLYAPATEPAYERIESSLLQSFAHMPKMDVPAKANRIFELRQYQSASEAAGKKKIEMFNYEGEIDIFKRLGFRPVFFGETVIGPLRPNLTYMITFDDMAAHDAHWKSFIADPEWKKISSVPDYADAKLVSKITSTMLVPASYSQI